MVELIDSIVAIADQFDAIVFDQWGVLHDGQDPYPGALQALSDLKGCAPKLAVLSNSGKRAMPNADRIAAKGFDIGQFDIVMTSGEALWHRFASGDAQVETLYPIQGSPDDAAKWSVGLAVKIAASVEDADSILLMGLPDGGTDADYDAVLQAGLDRGLPLYCSNPDLTSPRAGGIYVMSPGLLAQRYQKMGGTVHLYGKPYGPIFAAMQSALGCVPARILMVGDSLHHDIKGAHDAGWTSLLIRAGIHAPNIGEDTVAADIAQLASAAGVAPPTFSLPDLR